LTLTGIDISLKKEINPYIQLNISVTTMKHLLFLILACSFMQLKGQNTVPLAIEDKKMDAYLTARKPATLNIQIKNLPDSVKKVNIKYTLVQLGIAIQATKFTKTNTTGYAEIVVDQNLPYQQIWLEAGDYLYAGIYINSGLTITIDARKIPKDGAYMISDGVTYSGTDGELNTVMNKHILFRKKERGSINDSLRNVCQGRKKYTEDTFAFKADSMLKLLTKIDNDFIDEYPAYGWAVKNETLSEFYGNICVAYWYDAMPDKLFKAVSSHQPYFISNDGVGYYNYLGTYCLTQKRFNQKDVVAGTIKLFDSLYTQQKADVFKLFLLEKEKDNYAISYSKIINGIKTRWCKKIATTELAKVSANQKRIDSLFAQSKKLDKADIGTPLVQLPFNARLYSLDTITNIDNFILNLKRKFPNKAIILDFWATWCAPCIADIPYSKKLHEKNIDLPIEYIYLCTNSGSNINVWKNRIGDMQIPGTHIYVNDKIINKIRTAFNAGAGYPAYVVIDKNGKVNAKAISYMQSLTRESLKKAVGI
jgi:thiol-disulfide isomerase/thioredoxin